MIETLRRRTSRPRPTVARLMTWVATVAVVLGLAGSLIRLRPYWLPHGGTVYLGIFCAVLYLPVLPALLIWQMRSPRRTSERNRRVAILLVLCFLGWIGAVFLTFRSIIGSLGL